MDDGGSDPGDDSPGDDAPDNGTPDEPVMGWSLNGAESDFSFITVKNTNVAEAQSFQILQAFVDTSGKATLAIDLNTVDTGIGIRDERIRDYLFASGLLPTLYFSTQVYMSTVTALEPGEAEVMTLDGRLSLNGISQDTTAEVLVIRTADDRVAVRTAHPVKTPATMTVVTTMAAHRAMTVTPVTTTIPVVIAAMAMTKKATPARSWTVLKSMPPSVPPATVLMALAAQLAYP